MTISGLKELTLSNLKVAIQNDHFLYVANFSNSLLSGLNFYLHAEQIEICTIFPFQDSYLRHILGLCGGQFQLSVSIDLMRQCFS